MGQNEAGTLAALKAHRRELIDREISSRGGRIINAKGDGVLVEFASVVAAVECAAAIQVGVADRNRSVPPDERIEFRIGVNLDEVIADGADIFGDGVNIAARLEAFADPGTVCISSAVFNQVKNRVGYVFGDLGMQRFKNIAEPVHVFCLDPTRTGDASSMTAHSGEVLCLPDKPSIAILPFANLSGDPAQDYLAEGLRLDIQATLVHASGLFLIAPGNGRQISRPGHPSRAGRTRDGRPLRSRRRRSPKRPAPAGHHGADRRGGPADRLGRAL
jgi:adenylate cyclase